VVFLLYLAFIDCVKDPVPRNHYIFARGSWGDVCASRRGVVFLLYLAFIDCVKDPVPRNHYIFARGAWGDVCASRRGAGIPSIPCVHRSCKRPRAQKSLYLCSFLLHLALIAILLHLALLAIPCLFYVCLARCFCVYMCLFMFCFRPSSPPDLCSFSSIFICFFPSGMYGLSIGWAWKSPSRMLVQYTVLWCHVRIT
jgi:hypothetical protein